MVKCVCGREFGNMGKLMRHVRLKDSPEHVPDLEHRATEKSVKRYNKSH